MKSISKRIALFLIGALIIGTMPTKGVALAAVESPVGTDSYSAVRGIDSLTSTNLSCKAGNNVSCIGDNIIKLHLKEHNNTASTGKQINAFSVFTDHPDWIRVVAVDTGVNANLPTVVGNDNFPSARQNSGRSITVKNHIAEYDVNGRQIYEGGAIIFLVANNYAGRGTEIDRKVSVTVVSRTSKDTMLYEDITNLTVDIDAKEPEVVKNPDPTDPPAATQLPKATTSPSTNNGGGSNNNNNNNNNNTNINIGNIGDNNNININININPGQTQQPEATPKAKATEDPKASKDPEASEDPDYKDGLGDDGAEDGEDAGEPAEFDLGDEIEEKGATYIVTEDEDGYEVEFSDVEDNHAASVNIPNYLTVDGVAFAVTSISDGLLKGNKWIKSLTIGANITEIGDKAFWGCKNLRTIKITSKKLKLSNIGYSAFSKIPKNATIRCPKEKINLYKKIFRKRGLSKSVKFKKI